MTMTSTASRVQDSSVTMPAYCAVADALVELGVAKLFGLLGDGNLRFAVAARDRGIDYMGARHENSAIAMADGFARLSGEVGVATVTMGPGLTNSAAGLEEAVRAHTPLVVIAGAVGAEFQDYSQLLDQDGMVRTLGCGVQRYRRAPHVVEDLVSAFIAARAERRPVVLAIPVDEQEDPVPATSVRALPTYAPSRPDAATVAEIAELLGSAERPVIIGGWGAFASGSRDALIELGDRIGALMCSTAVTKGLFEGDPWDATTSGGFTADGIARVLESADIVLAFGASLNRWTTRGGTLYPRAQIVQFDDRDTAFGAHTVGIVPVRGDARLAAEDLLASLDGPPSVGFRTREVAEQLALFHDGDPFHDASDGSTIDPRTLTLELSRRLPANSVVATDSGAWVGFAGSYFRPKRPGSYLFGQASQCLGLGIAHTLGAVASRPESVGVSLIGDGGLLMSLGELETVIRTGRPHLVVVYNDSAYAAEIHVGRHHGLPVDLVRFPETDFAAVAIALGGRGVVARTVEDLAAIDEWSASPQGLLLIDARVDPEIPAPLWREFFRTQPSAAAAS